MGEPYKAVPAKGLNRNDPSDRTTEDYAES